MEVLKVSSPDEMTEFREFSRMLYAEDARFRTYDGEAHYKALQSSISPAAGQRQIHVQAFLIKSGNATLGRGAAILNRDHLAKFNDNVGFFGFFESIDSYEPASRILQTIEACLSGQGCSHIRGPVSPTLNEYPGILVAGFEQEGSPFTSYNKRYYQRLLEQAGYFKKIDLLAFEVLRSNDISRFDRRAEQIKRDGVRIRPVSLIHVVSDLTRVWHVYEEAFSENWSEVAIPRKEFVTSIAQMLPFVSRTFLQIAEVDREIVGFALAMPDTRRIDSLPMALLNAVAILKELASLRRCPRARIPLLGIRRDFRGSGLDFLLIRSIWRACLDQGVEVAELSWVLETNLKMIKPIRRIGGSETKRWRIFEKELAQ
jgi:hypothetical protein